MVSIGRTACLVALLALVVPANFALAADTGLLVLTAGKKSSGAKVRGYTQRRGSYSYSYEDSINTYGDARGSYGRADSLRDRLIDRQTNSGPFDHGFFFDSGIAPRGGDSPYMN
jgi:hypothetical protein